MAEETNWLLTDEFVQFSAKISAIHEKKKTKKAELKAFYDKVQSCLLYTSDAADE